MFPLCSSQACKYLAFTFLLVGTTPLICLAQPSRPNVVFILADDLGIGDVGCYGRDRCQIETPNIDSLASQGIKFLDAHVNASVCVPTRVAIMTGRYPWRFGPPQAGGAWGFLGPRFSTDTFTMADAMGSVGYQTNYIGKWHLGTVMTTLDGEVQNERNVDYSAPLIVGPQSYGFAESFILPGSLDMYPYAFVKGDQWVGTVDAQKGWSAFNRIGPAERDFEDHQVLETFCKEAEQFISRQNTATPFFLYLALTAPHTPTCPSEAFRGASEIGVYGDFVMEVDHIVGRVVEALESADLSENTMVIFSSDHGAASYAGNILEATPGQIRDLEELGHYASGIYRGYKFSVYEGGLRVPLLVKWPAAIDRAIEIDALIGLNDLFATFAELTDTELDTHHAPDSISFANLIFDPTDMPRRTNLIAQSTGPFVVRDQNWKLCLCPGSGASGRYGNEPSAENAWGEAMERYGQPLSNESIFRYPFVQLFDLDVDPGESNNLAGEHPERVEAMIELLQHQIENGRSTDGERLENGRKRVNLHPQLPPFVREALR